MIACLELKQNKLVNCAGLHHMMSLTELYLNQNELTSLKELNDLPCLRKLDVNTNKLESLDDIPHLPALEHFDVGANLIEKPDELPKLGGLRRLQVLIMAGNPWADEKGDDLKKEVLIALDELHIRTVNEDEITPEDRTEAAETKKERI